MNTSLTDDFPLSRSELLSPLIFCLLLPCLKQLNPVIVVRGANVTIRSSGQQLVINVISNPSSNQGNNQNSNPTPTPGQGTGQGTGQLPGPAGPSISPDPSSGPTNQQQNIPSLPSLPSFPSQVQPQTSNQRPNRTRPSRPSRPPDSGSSGSSSGSSNNQSNNGNGSNPGINLPADILSLFQVTSSPGNQNMMKTFESPTDIDKVTGNPGRSLYLQSNSRRRLAQSKVSNQQNKRPANRQRNKVTLSNESTINLQRRVKQITRNSYPLNRRLVGSRGNNKISCRQTSCYRQRQTNRKT